MAVMSSRKKGIAHGWEAINKKRDEEAKKLREQSEQKEEVGKEDHEARIKMLKDLGLVK